MKTADFLPPQEFETHLERRQTPKRVAILAIFTLICGVGALALELEAAFQEAAAVRSEAPDQNETQAGLELKEIYAEMSEYVDRLDPLADHLRMPASGRILASLAAAVGDYVQIEKIEWVQAVRRKGTTVENAELQLVLTCLVRGDRTLLELPEKLKEYTEFDIAWIDENTELVLEMRDTVRAEIYLADDLLVPGMTKPLRPNR